MTKLMTKRALIAAFLSVALHGAAAACTLSLPAGANRVVPAGNLNTSLLDAAVRAEVNVARCQAGLPPLRAAPAGLARAAEAHSRWMASEQSLSHRSNVRGRRTLGERFRAAGVRPRTGSENIGYVSRFQIDGRQFRILDARSCRFATQSGQALPPHTYASLARHMVNQWMASSGHRRNILDRKVDSVGTGAAFDPAGPHCGRFWFTQNFIG